MEDGLQKDNGWLHVLLENF
jgi:hypothetical protein